MVSIRNWKIATSSDDFLLAVFKGTASERIPVRTNTAKRSCCPLAVNSLDVHVMENTPLMKDSGAVVQTLPATSATERLGSGISDPSLTTGDALD
ncbi:hypothetical protein AAC387_Pa06g1191 [Persea americana]